MEPFAMLAGGWYGEAAGFIAGGMGGCISIPLKTKGMNIPQIHQDPKTPEALSNITAVNNEASPETHVSRII